MFIYMMKVKAIGFLPVALERILLALPGTKAPGTKRSFKAWGLASFTSRFLLFNQVPQ